MEIGKSDCKCALSDDALEECKEFCSKKNRECTCHQNERNLQKIANSSKSTDLVLWLVVQLQLVDESTIFLKNNKDLDRSKIVDHEQPLIPDAAKIEEIFLSMLWNH